MGRKGAELSPDVKTVITQLYEDGSSITRISKLLDIPRTTVSMKFYPQISSNRDSREHGKKRSTKTCDAERLSEVGTDYKDEQEGHPCRYHHQIQREPRKTCCQANTSVSSA